MTSQIKSRGFTIVELLIVIVIIAILAAITIVAYNGITARANTSSAQSAAENAIKKAEAFNADDQGGNGSYPLGPKSLTGSASTNTFYLSGVSFTLTALSAAGANPTAPNVLNYYSCTPTGLKVTYYDYSAKVWVPQYTGGASASSTCTYQANTVGTVY